MGKTTLRIDYLFFCTVVLMLILNGQITLYVLLLSLCHELGHVIAMVSMGGKIKLIRMSSFGMVLMPFENNFSLLKDAIFALSGPLVNIIISLVFLMSENETFAQISAMSLLLGVFNLLPVSALDGGKALKCIMLYFLEEEKSEKAMRIISIIVLLLLAMLSLLLLKNNIYNYSLVFIVVYLTIFLINKPMN